MQGQVQETVQIVRVERESRQAFEHAATEINAQRGAALAIEMQNAQGMLQAAAQAIQSDTMNSVARLHESIQLVERAMDASRNELAQVLDAEIRTRQKQESKTEVSLATVTDQVSSYKTSSDRAIQDVAALATRVSEETRGLAKREVLAVKDQHARLAADTDTRFSMVMVQLTRLDGVQVQIPGEIGGKIEARCAFFDRNLHSRMPLVPTPARLKRAGV
jgi:hypothetical protein